MNVVDVREKLWSIRPEWNGEEVAERVQAQPTGYREAVEGRIEEARVNHIIQHRDGTKLQVDFGRDETALIELWQVLED